MTRFAWIFAGLLMAPAAAFACSCVATEDPAELKRMAEETAPRVQAVVEAEALTSFEATGTGERMRVVRTLAGRAPADFTVARGPMPSSASCDVLYRVGERTLVILYPPVDATGGAYPTAGLCTEHLLQQPAFRDALVNAIRGRGERG